MKNVIKAIAAVCALGALMTVSACSSKNTEPTASAATQPPVTEAVTERPTEAATETPTDAPTEPPAEAPTDAPENDGAKNELTSHKWQLINVYTGEKRLAPDSYYGSIIRQTGASLSFSDDNTFSCSLGYKGCKGTYSVRAGAIDVHITTVFSGSSAAGESADDYVTMDWDLQQGTIIFDYFGASNEFGIK